MPGPAHYYLLWPKKAAQQAWELKGSHVVAVSQQTPERGFPWVGSRSYFYLLLQALTWAVSLLISFFSILLKNSRQTGIIIH